MNNLYKKIGLIDFEMIDLKLSKDQIFQKLKLRITDVNTGMGVCTFEGTIEPNGFELRSKRQFRFSKLDQVKALGTITRQGDSKSRIEIEFNGYYNGLAVLFFIFLSSPFLLALFVYAKSENLDSTISVFNFLMIQNTILLLLLYLVIRGGVRKMKKDLKMELELLVM